jgi:ferredoxin
MLRRYGRLLGYRSNFTVYDTSDQIALLKEAARELRIDPDDLEIYKVLQLFSKDEMTQEPTVAYVVEEICSGCGVCVEICPYEARELDPVRHVATVNAALCENCGACLVACPNKATRIRNWTPEQILAMADAVMG